MSGELVAVGAACLASLLLLALVVGVGVLAFRRVRARQRELAARWERVAPHVGLALDPAITRREGTPRTMRGERHGLPVEASWALRSAGPRSRQTVTVTTVRARIEPPLRLGLRMTADLAAQSLGAAVVRGLMLEDVTVGVPDLDAAFRIQTRDAGRLRAMLDAGGADALRSFLAGARAGWAPTIDDGAVAVMRVGLLDDPPALSAALDAAARLATALREARRYVPAEAWEQQLAASWGAAAGRLGLVLDPHGLALQGTRGAPPIGLRAWTEVASSGWSTVLDARFPVSLGAGLRLHTEVSLGDLARALGMIDIRTGDGPFDVRFMVQGYDETAIRALLGAPVRAALLGLASRASRVELDDRGLRVVAAGVLVEPAHLEAALGELEGAARTLVQAVTAGPFR